MERELMEILGDPDHPDWGAASDYLVSEDDRLLEEDEEQYERE